MKPQIILADEPTASLDVENREIIVSLLFKMNKNSNTTIITVTHDLDVAIRHDRIIRIEHMGFLLMIISMLLGIFFIVFGILHRESSR